MTRNYVVTRVQESVVDVDSFVASEDEDPVAVAIEVADAISAWNTVHLTAEEV